jgi:hypothetical protein
MLQCIQLFKLAQENLNNNPPTGDLIGESGINLWGELHPAAKVPVCQDMAQFCFTI